jgi:hypothetical protein
MDEEAEKVRTIFRRYLALGSIGLLVEISLRKVDQGIWTSSASNGPSETTQVRPTGASRWHVGRARVLIGPYEPGDRFVTGDRSGQWSESGSESHQLGAEL